MNQEVKSSSQNHRYVTISGRRWALPEFTAENAHRFPSLARHIRDLSDGSTIYTSPEFSEQLTSRFAEVLGEVIHASGRYDRLYVETGLSHRDTKTVLEIEAALGIVLQNVRVAGGAFTRALFEVHPCQSHSTKLRGDSNPSPRAKPSSDSTSKRGISQN